SGEVKEIPPRQESYHHGDEEIPVIPGSSLRGGIRSLVEILAAARLTRRIRPGVGSRVRYARLVYRAVADRRTSPGMRYAKLFENVQGGWLEQAPTGWQIRPAILVEGQSFARVPRGKITGHDPEIRQDNPSPGNLRVWVCGSIMSSGALVVDRLRRKREPGLHEATLVPSGEINGRQKFAAVFSPDLSANPLPIPKDLWLQWEEDRDLKRGLPNRKVEGPEEPVFYLVEDGVLTFFGPTQNFRVPY